MKKRIKRLSGLFLAAVMVTLSAVIPVHAAGWQENDTGRWYEKQDGSWPENEWKLIGHKWYYFNGAGYAATGWQQLDGGWYYFGEDDGQLETNAWVDEYYVGSDGRMLTDAWIGHYQIGRASCRDIVEHIEVYV